MEISLSGQKWQVKGYWPWIPVKETSMETGQKLHGVTDWLDAKVPGSVHYDLWKAGLIENPYYGTNSLHCEWVENRWWMYRTTFPLHMNGYRLDKNKVSLVCKGMDYEAMVYLNDRLLGSHRGMYDAFCADITPYLQEENRLVIVFKNAPQEMGQIGYTSQTSTQKSRFNYKWDFSTRLVNIGLWKDVALLVEEEASIEDVHLRTGYQKDRGWLSFSGILKNNGIALEDMRLKFTVTGPFDRRSMDIRELKRLDAQARTLCAEQEEGTEGQADFDGRQGTEEIHTYVKECQPEKAEISEQIEIPGPALWKPNGEGIPWIYQLRVEVFRGEEVVFHTDFSTGIRSLELLSNDGASEEALPYTFTVNGKKIWIKGMNITPLDHIYGNVTGEQYGHLVTAMVHAGVNLVRVWGGGLIEREEFYTLCDENGILIWQEFIQSSSGIDNKPCEETDFLSLLETAAIAAVKEKRNHVSLAVYSGGNELMEEADRPVDFSNSNISMLKSIVEQYDGDHFFFPTSASGPREFITVDKDVSHDIHGNWRYEGNPDHYSLYGESDSLFHSEFGVDGAASVKSLKKFMPVSSLHPTPMSEDSNWRHHGEWWGTYFRDCEMFGEIPKTAEQLETFVKCSQYMQSEGLRFILEADRRRAFRNSGAIIWQLNEPWPNASCTSLVDYYGETKSAYYQAKRCFEKNHISLDYRRLTYTVGENVSFSLHVSGCPGNDSQHISALVRTLGGDEILSQAYEIPAERGDNIKPCMLEIAVPDEKVFFVTLLLTEEQEKKHSVCARRVLSENTYMFSAEEKVPFGEFLHTKTIVRIVHTEWHKMPKNRILATVTLENCGNRAALEVGIELEGSRYYQFAAENNRILFPGEKMSVSVWLIPKHAGTFLEDENWDGEEQPFFTVKWL